LVGDRGRPGFLNCAFDVFCEAIAEQWLQQNALDARRGGPLRYFIVGIAGDENDGGADVVASQLRDQIEAVHVRHLVVDDEAVDVGRLCRAQQRGPASEGPDLESIGFQKEAQRPEDADIVINDVNCRFVG